MDSAVVYLQRVRTGDVTKKSSQETLNVAKFYVDTNNYVYIKCNTTTGRLIVSKIENIADGISFSKAESVDTSTLTEIQDLI